MASPGIWIIAVAHVYMSMRAQYAQAGQAATAPHEEEDCKNLRSGVTFRAKIQPISDLVLTTDTAIDPRASDFFNLRDRTTVILVTDEILSAGGRFQILPGAVPDDAMTVHRKFLAMQLTDQDS